MEKDEDDVKKVLGIQGMRLDRDPDMPMLTRPIDTRGRVRFGNPEPDSSFEKFERMMKSNRGME